MKQLSSLLAFTLLVIATGCTNTQPEVPPTAEGWKVDFFDDFVTFNDENWQDQRIWVNNETQCYVPNGEYGTREVSDGTLKLKVVNI